MVNKRSTMIGLAGIMVVVLVALLPIGPKPLVLPKPPERVLTLDPQLDADSPISLEPGVAQQASVGVHATWTIAADAPLHQALSDWLKKAKSPWTLRWDTVELRLPVKVEVPNATVTEAVLGIARVLTQTTVRFNFYPENKTFSVYTGKFDRSLHVVTTPNTALRPAPMPTVPILPGLPKNLGGG